MLRLPRRATSTCLLLLLTSTTMTGCVSWQSQMTSTTIRPQTDVRLTRPDGTKLLLVHAEIRGDSVHGYGMSRSRQSAPPTYAMPLADVQNLEVRRFSGEHTFGLVFGIAAFFGGLALLIDNSLSGPLFGPTT